MYLKIYLLISSLFIQIGLFSQNKNLILNGDFESFFNLKTQKPSKINIFKNRKEAWYACSIIKSEHWNIIDPQKSFRYCKDKSIAHSGNNCAAIKVYDNIDIESKLFTYNNLIGSFSKALEKDKSYRISFFIKPFIGDFLSNKFEVYVSDTLIQYLAYKEFKVIKNKNHFEVKNLNNIKPIFSLQEILKDTNNFKKIEFIYKANGKERFIYFGNITGSVPNKMIKASFGYDKSKFKNPIRIILIDDISVVEVQNSDEIEKAKKTIEIPQNILVKKIDLYFKPNASTLDKEQERILNEILLSLNKISIDSIYLEAKCSDIGSEEDNFLLSSKRAKSIEKILVSASKNYTNKIIIFSNGEQALKSDNNIVNQRKLNRSVSLLFYGKAKEIYFENILFEANKVEILPQSLIVLDSITKFLQTNTTRKIELQGHICCYEFEGKTFNNKRYLSKERAKAIYKFLIQKGIQKNRITYSGFEADKKIYRNKTPEHYLNRRVEIILK